MLKPAWARPNVIDAIVDRTLSNATNSDEQIIREARIEAIETWVNDVCVVATWEDELLYSDDPVERLRLCAMIEEVEYLLAAISGESLNLRYRKHFALEFKLYWICGITDLYWDQYLDALRSSEERPFDKKAPLFPVPKRVFEIRDQLRGGVK